MTTSCVISGISEEQLRSFIKICKILWTKVAKPLAEQNAYISKEDILVADAAIEFLETCPITQI